MTAARRALWISDDPGLVERVIGYLRQEMGTPLCDSCIAIALYAPISGVRDVLDTLHTRKFCDRGLWWCGRCSAKSSVAIMLATHKLPET